MDKQCVNKGGAGAQLVAVKFIELCLRKPIESDLNQVIVNPILYRPTHSGDPFKRESTRPQRVLLVTAHPDDECLFFAPTIFGLANGSQLNDASQDGSIGQNNENELFSLCLSVGDADGLGHVRKEEYEKSLDVMGIKDTNRIALDDPYLQDSMEVSWDVDYIADVVADFVIHHNITTILSFDQGGVSDHPNHKIIPFGIQRMISAYPVYPPPKFYVLITVPLSIKPPLLEYGVFWLPLHN
ncbi:like protein [Lentinula edodes]|uniref:N-acetylglucosaminylphosphatidylinositol deacetylase n=1 Tax=Lentinula edodes TaxID=5353 RepID=A0A1Q3DV21_LENED|nr:like protein [Lentinula edodes]